MQVVWDNTHEARRDIWHIIQPVADYVDGYTWDRDAGILRFDLYAYGKWYAIELAPGDIFSSDLYLPSLNERLTWLQERSRRK